MELCDQSDKMIVSVFFLLLFSPKINMHNSSNERDCHSQPFLKCTEGIHSKWFSIFSGQVCSLSVLLKGSSGQLCCLWLVLQRLNHELLPVKCTVTFRPIVKFLPSWWLLEPRLPIHRRRVVSILSHYIHLTQSVKPFGSLPEIAYSTLSAR